MISVRQQGARLEEDGPVRLRRRGRRGRRYGLKVPPRDAQVILGHSHITTTQQIYTHVDEAARDALTKLNKLLGGNE